MRILDVRHEQTAAFAAEATGKLDPGAGARRAHRRAGCHQRHQRHRPGAVRRVADGRRRRPRPAEPLGQRQPPGARPAADRRLDHQERTHDPDRRRGGRRVRRGLPPGRLLPPRPGLRRRTRWTSSSTRRRRSLPDGSRTRGAEPDSDAVDRIGRLLADAERPVLILGTDVWADGAEEAALELVEAARHPRDHQRHGPRRRPRRPPAAGDQGARQGAEPRRPGRRRRHARSTSGSGTACSAARTAPSRPASSTSPTPPARSRGTPTLADSVSGDLSTVLPGLAAALDGTDRSVVEGLGRGPAGGRPRAPRRATRSCSRPRPTRSTRPASTASCSPGWPTTRS